MERHNTITKQASGPVFHILDLVKFIGALLVVLIHTAPLEPYSAVANFYTKDVIARVAVPLFFAISGFFFARKPDPVKTFTRIALLYLGWSAAYLLIQIPQWYQSGWWGLHVVLDYILGLVTVGTYFHLWYLLATLYAIPLLYLLVKRASPRLMLRICCVFWLIECLAYSYAWIGIDRIPVLMSVFSRLGGICNGVLRALPLMLIGVFCHQNASNYPASYWRKRAVISLCFLITEASLLHFATPNSGLYSYLFATPFFTYYLLCGLLCSRFQFRRPETALVLRKSSLTIYCVHPFIDYFVERSAIAPGICTWLTVTLSSVILSTAYSILALRRRNP